MITFYKEQVLRHYKEIQMKENLALELRKKEIITKYPIIVSLDDKIENLSVKRALAISGVSDFDIIELDNLINKIQKEKEDILIKNGYDKDYLTVHYSCKECNDTGYIGNRKCNCFYNKLIELYLNDSGLTEDIRKATFDKFDLSLYPNKIVSDEKISSVENMTNILNYIKCNYINNFSENLLFYGTIGSGKTFISLCIATEMLNKGLCVIFRKANELIKDFSEFNAKGQENIKNLLYNCDLLIIDSLGTEYISDFSLKQLYYLIDYRIINNKRMIINTSFELSELLKTYSEIICSRLFGEFKFCKMYSEDIRIKKHLIHNKEKK